MSATEYERARDALICLRELPDAQALAFGLAEAIGDVDAFGTMVSLTREAERLVETGAAPQRAPEIEAGEHIVFAVPPSRPIAERLAAIGARWEMI
jgi:hypothetical protein